MLQVILYYQYCNEQQDACEVSVTRVFTAIMLPFEVKFFMMVLYRFILETVVTLIC